MGEDRPTEPEWVRAAAADLFGERLPLAEAYAELLTSDGVLRGLIGPREAPRIWERHLLNCAVVAELIPTGVHVVDVGSGAGLPGIVLAVARPDLTVTLVEPMARRTSFLTEVISALDLRRVTVLQARAEEAADQLSPADVVTARALARLDRLAEWCLPLTAVGGRVLAIKGESAPEEIAAYGAAAARWGGAPPVLRRCGVGRLRQPTTVVEIIREQDVRPRSRTARRKRRG
ncbi:MAG TPA: 16S rRNA (guanine(527)-N(7))-methyltransferase RsmG [Natronosporangium sp.]|nr:16S rRNA (guanine(527)-N(7))-methyltransferase RsmG [Natronosporangium sp.]